MSKRWLASLLILALALPAAAQSIVSLFIYGGTGTSLPATCSPNVGATAVFVHSGGLYYCSAMNTWTLIGAGGGSGLAADGSTTGATAQSQPFTNGLKTTATTGLVGVGMTPVAMLDVTVPSGVIGVQAVGTQPAAMGGGSNGIPGSGILTAASPAGGDTSSTTASRNGGIGGPILLQTGNGGQQTGASSGSARGGNGGIVTIQTGNGGAATAVTGTVKGGAGGLVTLSTGAGGTSATSVGGAGGAVNITPGVGGITTAPAAAGKGGSVTVSGGQGGDNAQAAGTAGAGGDITITPGSPGNASGGAAAGVSGTTTLAGQVVFTGATSKGTCTLNGGATATCTATVLASCTVPICTYNGIGHAVGCSTSGTTMTATSGTTLDSGTVNWWCP